MQSGDFATNGDDDKSSFKDLIVQQIRSILKILNQELRVEKKTILLNQGSGKFTEEKENTHKSLHQSVEAFGIIISGELLADEKEYKKFLKARKIMNSYGFKVIKMFPGEWEEIQKQVGKDEPELKNKFVQKQKDMIAKDLFLDLMLFCKKRNYFKDSDFDEDEE